MDNNPVDFLANEIDAMLGAGRVGLYEFPQFLRLAFPDFDAAEERRISSEVLNRLLTGGEVKLVWARWADTAPAEDATGVTPPDASWDGLNDEPYLALEPS